MGPRTWRTLILVTGAAVLALTTGTAVKAMIDGRGEPVAQPPAAARQAVDQSVDDSSSLAAACVEGSDCNDTPFRTDREKCAADGTCVAPSCPPNADCPLRGVPEPAPCPAAAPLNQCGPNGLPTDHNCVSIETFPVQVKCYPIVCPPIGGPITILPAPTTDGSTAVTDPIPPSIVEPAPEPRRANPPPEKPTIACPPIGCGVEMPSDVQCPPIEPCKPGADVRCIEPCRMAEGGTIGCPVPPPCNANERCIPPECAISSDGIVACPTPEPCPLVEGGPSSGPSGCSSPPSCGDAGCEPVPCAERPELDYECAYPDTPIVGDVPGSSGGGSAEVGIATAEPATR